MKKTIYYCDVCKEENKIQQRAIQCLFISEQTEGRAVKPYLDLKSMDICEDCYSKVISGNYIWASGAQGINKFWFKGKE